VDWSRHLDIESYGIFDRFNLAGLCAATGYIFICLFVCSSWITTGLDHLDHYWARSAVTLASEAWVRATVRAAAPQFNVKWLLEFLVQWVLL
jgi:hypothetical protein